ncbi:ERF family protein [Sphingobacterium sp. N143]|uniref:ERF family protein n=1 Tax=Sphingobacterium sp. N143 TaxID=2746727 RepID=UPI002574D9E5|nr:ERF family protein [Sphingobacterium sp. N143]MDM1294270.1 ERF family protein [Sphingobacterium sp. N143]
MGIKQKIFDIRKNIGKLTKDTANPFFKSKYADINQLIEMTDPLLADKQILITMPIRLGFVVVELTDLESGETMESAIELPQSNDPQKTGSAITYFRRYALKSLLNIQEEDDDANKASGNIQEEDDDANKASGNIQEEDVRPWLTETQFNSYLALINKGEKWLDKIKKKYRIKKAFSTTLESAEKNYKPKT